MIASLPFCNMASPRRAVFRLFIIGACLLGLSACGSGGWFGDDEAPPLPGKRISVLLSESDAEPDPRLADLNVKLPIPYANESWPQAGGFADHAMHHLLVADTVEQVWSADIGAGSEGDQRILSGPVLAKGLIFSMDRYYQISAFDAQNGRLVWSVEANVPDEDDEAFGGGLAYSDGILLASTGYAQVMAFKADSGDFLWESKVSAPVRSAPTVADGRAIVTTLDNQAFAFNIETGETVWRHAGFAEVAGLLGSASPAISGRSVILPYSSGELFSLRLGNGRVNWQENMTSTRRIDALSNLADIRGKPVVDRGVVYAVSHAGRMSAIDLRSGARVWDRQIGGTETPWVAGDFLYLLTTDQVLICLTRRGGRVRWAAPLPRYEDEEDREDPIIWVGPVLVKDRLLIGNNLGELLAVSPYTGEPLGKQDLGGAISIAPIVANETIYVQMDSGRLIALR